MPSPPPSPSRDGHGGDLDDLSLARLSLRPLLTAASMPVPSPPTHDAVQFPAAGQLSDASVARSGLLTVSQTQQQEESCLEFELDSPPRLTFLKIPEYLGRPTSPGSPTSPRGGPPTSIDVEPSVLPTFKSQNSGKWHSSDTEDDSYFECLVNNFIIAADDACKPPEDNIDKKASTQRQSERYAESALKYYNNDKDNKVKYALISAITSCGIVDRARCYGHVNFIAKGNQENSKEELFFAELQLGSHVPTCVVSLEGAKIVGGLHGSKYDGHCESKYDRLDVKGMYIDAQHCYGCGSKVKHPKNGALYETGHVPCSGFYHG